MKWIFLIKEEFLRGNWQFDLEHVLLKVSLSQSHTNLQRTSSYVQGQRKRFQAHHLFSFIIAQHCMYRGSGDVQYKLERRGD